MSRYLVRTRFVFEECKNYLQNTGAWGTSVESYLTEHILVVLCGDMQQELYKIAEDRAQQSGDQALHEFVSGASVKILRSIRKKEIAIFIRLFGNDFKEKFNASLDDRDVTIYNNAVIQRNRVAHQGGGTMTFNELPDAIFAAYKILESAEEALIT